MTTLLLNTIALDPNRWTADKKPHYRLEDLLPEVTTAGFPRLEVWQHHLTDLTEQEVVSLHARARANGVAFPIVGLYPRLHLEGDEQEQEGVMITQAFDRAVRLGAHVVKCFAGRFGADETDESVYARSVGFFRAMAEQAASRRLTITAETHPGTLCDSVSACRRFLHEVEAPNLRLCFQPFDFSDTARAVADYESLREYISHIHLQGHRHGTMSLLAEADIDYRELLAALADGDFDGYLCIEFVEGCVVDTPAAFNLDRVLANARRDRDFVFETAQSVGLAIEA